jgi:hypothetical protein
MGHLLGTLVVTALGFSMAWAADPPQAAPFSNKAFGDGGGYKHPDREVGRYIEEVPKNPSPKPEIVTSRPRPRPFAAPPPAPAPASAPAQPYGPVAVGGVQDAESEDARRDYESRLLGAAPERARPGLGAGVPPLASAGQSIPPAAMEEGMLFVSLELDPKEAGGLRDAVAGLGAAAAFRPDARFQALAAEGGRARISGWLPASRLGDVISRPGVTRIAVERAARPAGDARVTGDFLLRLRLADPARPEESLAESIRTVTAATDFKLDGVYAIETVPGVGATALVSGRLPLAQLARALGLPGVLKVSAALSSAEKPGAASAAPAAPKMTGFFAFVMNRALWLVLLTILLALPTVGDVIKSGLAVFVPYR